MVQVHLAPLTAAEILEDRPPDVLRLALLCRRTSRSGCRWFSCRGSSEAEAVSRALGHEAALAKPWVAPIVRFDNRHRGGTSASRVTCVCSQGLVVLLGPWGV